jgi:hypothetical protein
LIEDVPSPIDLRSATDAGEWAAAAMAKRPWRTDFFAAIADAMAASRRGPARVLELGSGPGFLAPPTSPSISPPRCTTWLASD